MKSVTLPQFLTPAQIAEAVRLYEIHGPASLVTVTEILERVIEPNLAAINAKLGLDNNARYLAYKVLDALKEEAKFS